MANRTLFRFEFCFENGIDDHEEWDSVEDLTVLSFLRITGDIDVLKKVVLTNDYRDFVSNSEDVHGIVHDVSSVDEWMVDGFTTYEAEDLETVDKVMDGFKDFFESKGFTVEKLPYEYAVDYDTDDEEAIVRQFLPEL